MLLVCVGRLTIFIIAVFSITDMTSWLALDRLKDMVARSTKCPGIVVGNMSDLPSNRQVTRVEAEAKVIIIGKLKGYY